MEDQPPWWWSDDSFKWLVDVIVYYNRSELWFAASYDKALVETHSAFTGARLDGANAVDVNVTDRCGGLYLSSSLANDSRLARS